MKRYEFRYKKGENCWDCLTINASDGENEIVRHGSSEDEYQIDAGLSLQKKELGTYHTVVSHRGGSVTVSSLEIGGWEVDSALNTSSYAVPRHSEYVMDGSDAVLNIDLNDVMEDHIRSGAFLTLVTKRMDVSKLQFSHERDIAVVDNDGRITEIDRYIPKTGELDISTNIMILRRSDLQNALNEALARGYTSFHLDIIGKNLSKKFFHAYRYDGWYSQIDSLEKYFSASMQLLNPDVRHCLLGNPEREVYTKIRNSAPTKYEAGASVSNSLIADGCVIEGTVENSILFRGVHISRGTVVRNSILLQDTYVGSNVSLNCVITDKNASVRDDRVLSGHETMPFFIGKGMTV